MKRGKRIGFGIIMLLFIIAATITFGTVRKAQAAEKRLTSITAVYTGDTLLVGQTIDVEKLTVMGLYSDGSYVKLKDYSLSTYIVGTSGNNTIKIYSEGVTGTFTVKGKKVISLTAYYTESGVTAGEHLDPEKVSVQAYYSDGTKEKITEFTLSHTFVADVGKNEYTVLYEGATTKFLVTGREERKPKSFYARYSGPSVIVGNAPKREHFTVSVFYNDNTTEKITDFELTPAVIQKEGSNVVVVSYGELSAEVKINGLAKTVASIKAEYVGLPVVVGKTVASEDIIVTATFNDGTKDTVTNFTLSSSVIYKIGDNLLTVHCDGKIARINVRGVESEIIDYTHRAEALVQDKSGYSRVKIAVGAKVDTKQVMINQVDASLVRKAMRRLVQTDRYLAFEVEFAEPELDVYLPMTMKVSVPLGFDRDNFGVFYTTNRKTIMAQMNGEFLKDGTYEFKMFQPGTYIIADCTPLVFVESLQVEEINITLRLERSYSLDPEILPHTATNKEVKYSSSRPQIVTVSEYGTLKALKPGTSIITITATDGSGKKCTVRVNVVEKKGKYDADIAELNDALNKVKDSYDFQEFLEALEERLEEKEHDLSKRDFEAYQKEIDSWIGAWDDEFEIMSDTQWLRLLKQLYKSGEYFYGEKLFGDDGTFEKELSELEQRLDTVDNVDDFAAFTDFFWEDLEEKADDMEEKELWLYLMAVMDWAEDVPEEKPEYNWETAVWEKYAKWTDKLRKYK